MKKVDFRNYLKDKIMLLDGAFGTEMSKRGMPSGVCPEQWVLENPKALLDLQKEYVAAGSKVLYTCTFGGNKCKLSGYGLGDRTVEINKRLAELSREAAAYKAFVAGDISATGEFIEPFGDFTFEEAVDNYKLQVEGLLLGGVDFFVIETMFDIQEARAALIAVKECCDLPVCVSMTFDENGRTLTGTDPVTALITLQSLGADAVGCNCSTGPEKMVNFIRAMKPYARVPLLAKPNAGLPSLVDGRTVFGMSSEDFAKYAKSFVEAGVNMLGGCCGTSPEYIRLVNRELQGLVPIHFEAQEVSALTSTRKTVFIGSGRPLTVVGERINPTGKKKLQKELIAGEMGEVDDLAFSQVEKGAAILDVNAGMPGIDEKETMLEIVRYLASRVHVPLCIDSAKPEVIEAALRVYPGRALINSISGEREKLEKLLPVASKYGAMFILLPLDDNGIPATADERSRVIEAVFEKAQSFGFSKSDIVVDGLAMTVSSNHGAPMETLKTIKWANENLNCNTIIGLSNISFGLPERVWINSAFLSMAQAAGLTMAILNPSEEVMMNAKRAADLLCGKDKKAREYLKHFSSASQEAGRNNEKKAPESKVYDAIVKGDAEHITEYIKETLEAGMTPSDIVDKFMIPAITYTGELYEKKKYYLPQLLQSADAMKQGFAFVEPMLKTERDSKANAPKVVLATVKGDIHDIGKNIVGLMLRNYGFEVIDLGKDVPAHEIVKTARDEKAELIGLSALMTTTMHEMANVIRLCRSEGIDSKIMVGGAVVTEGYSQEIGADGYAPDAYAAVKLAKKLVGEK